jgi:hypothetical protein
MKYPILIFSLLIISVSSCTTSRSLASYYSSDAQCVSKNTDGSVTVKSWGSGVSFRKAVLDAQQHAVSEVLFKGVRAGDLNCQSKPLVPEVNAEVRFQTYFSKFFKNNEYAKYVALEEPLGRAFTRNYYRSTEGLTTFVTVRINVLELKSELVKNGIIK